MGAKSPLQLGSLQVSSLPESSHSHSELRAHRWRYGGNPPKHHPPVNGFYFRGLNDHPDYGPVFLIQSYRHIPQIRFKPADPS